MGRITGLLPGFRTHSHESYFVQADFLANGKTYTCVSDWGVSEDQFKIGDWIKIRYVKDNPVAAYMPPPQHVGPMAMFLVALGLGVIIAPRVARWSRNGQAAR